MEMQPFLNLDIDPGHGFIAGLNSSKGSNENSVSKHLQLLKTRPDEPEQGSRSRQDQKCCMSTSALQRWSCYFDL